MFIKDKDKKEVGKWWIFGISLVVLTVIVFAVIGYVGKVSDTIVEREVFEQSYQKQAGDTARMRTYRAQLAAIESRIYSETDENVLRELNAQKDMLEVQIKVGQF